MQKTAKILLIAGEASGDLLGANLARELFNRQPDLEIIALGGSKMREAGVQIIFDNRKMDIMGWLGVIKNIGLISQAKKTIKKIFKNSKPDLLILIDYPGFNLHIAKIAKKYGIKVLYYVSPQIWAWKYGRIKTIRRCVDHMAVLLPFEEQIYRQENIPVTFVGHPLTKLVHPTLTQDEIYQKYQLNSSHPIIAIFPGSRRHEINRLLPIMMAAVNRIRQILPNAQFLVPLASNLHREQLAPNLISGVQLIEGDTYNLLSVCSAAIVKSGTATLEVALSQTPLVIVYRCDFLQYWIARLIIKVKQIGLCNIVAQKPVAKELIQNAATPENIAQETIRLIKDTLYREQILADLANLRNRMLITKDSSEQVAKIALQYLN